jgi:hypothetical protein
MRLRFAACLVLPALAVAADGRLPTMAPTPARPPASAVSQDLLVDRVIPAYGMRYQLPGPAESRARGLTNRIAIVTARIEAAVAAGTLARAGDRWTVTPAKRSGDPAQATLSEPPVLAEQIQLAQLGEELSRLDADLIFPTLGERSEIDNALANLSRAGEALSHGLEDERLRALQESYRAWYARFAAEIALMRAARGSSLVTHHDLPAMDDLPYRTELGAAAPTAAPEVHVVPTEKPPAP